MANDVRPGPITNGGNCIKEAVCVHTDQVYDSCRDKECIEDIRVYFTECDQEIIDRAVNVRLNGASTLWITTDVEPVPFNQGYYTIDMRFYFKVSLDVYCDLVKPRKVEGLAIYDKKVVLFGSEGKSKIFRSLYNYDGMDRQLVGKTNLPQAVVEVVDPIGLSAKIVDACPPIPRCEACDMSSIPECICSVFDDTFADPNVDKRVYVTLGLFSITKLERNVQLLIPVYDFCIPNNECVSATQDNPCELFEKIDFPINEFYPPQKHDFVSNSNSNGLNNSNNNNGNCNNGTGNCNNFR